MRIYHTTPFNFLNETEIRIVLNKWGEVGIGITHPESISLSFLVILLSFLVTLGCLSVIFQKNLIKFLENNNH